MTFETNPRFLRDLLNDAHQGKLQLPDFQRSYVWGDDDVRSLIASIARGYPVGALLTLGAGGEVNFKPRLLEGVEAERKAAGEGPARPMPDELLLDGQQRITSLYGALIGALPMRVRKPQSERIHLERYYYLDVPRAMESGEDLESAIIGVPRDRLLRGRFGGIERDLSSREREFEEECLPLKIVFDQGTLMEWLWKYQQFWTDRGEDRGQRANRLMTQLIQPLQSYQMPVIRLSRDTSREAVCLVFEKVNVGGKKLDAFELVTAIFAGSEDPLDLRRDWEARHARIARGPHLAGQENRVFDDLRGLDFLQAVSLSITHARRRAEEARIASDDPDARARLPQVSARRDALLAMRLADFRAHAGAVEDGFREAGKFLNSQRILWSRDLPYPAQLVALAAIIAIAGKAAQSAAAKEKLALWFWRTSLAEDYGTSPEFKLARDAEEVARWLAGGPEPERMRLLTFNRDRLHTLRVRLSAAYRAFSALLMREGCRDFITGQTAEISTFGNDPMDLHHIFPRAWCAKKGFRREEYDSILNKTPLTAASNRAIGGAAPSEYLARIERDHGLSPAQLDEILRSHLIEPDFLRRDDFEGFIADREEKLAALAARAMGREGVVERRAPTEPELESADEDRDEDAA
ncbi:DUF262 domain-containing protein [Oceanicella actignis]|uniref:DUF262 domain-containing protein n=1 Tax=Oceanicella actignis TaxID=1189325 RepID=UPI0011E68B99|nr:DUF262 domain-containing protein [Oceanicella actignis]TYO84222.1 hypothetical protein LY05_02959 [Oceanicella actignis]